MFEGIQLNCAFRADLIVNDAVIVEIKSVETLSDVHFAQLLTYVKLARKPIGLLLNFNEARMVDGVRRMVGPSYAE